MNSQVILVRAARPEDGPAIAAFQVAMARETEDRTLDPQRVSAGVAAVLADPQKGRYFVVERAGRVVGGLLVTWEWSDWRNGLFWWIQSVYVAPEARRTGVYRALHEHVQNAARATPGVCGVRLYVDRENRAAQQVYRRLGMHESNYALFEVDWA